MGIGGSIFLIVVGLILAFAVNFRIAGIDIQLIGLILAAAGVLGLVLFFTIWSPRRRTVTSRTYVDGGGTVPPAGEVRERRVYDDGPPLG